ncbi:MAG: hypothetical protein ACKOBA_00495 [Limnohabitans sp.]
MLQKQHLGRGFAPAQEHRTRSGMLVRHRGRGGKDLEHGPDFA